MAATVSPGPVTDYTPEVTVINAKQRVTDIFAIQIAANAGDTRFARTDLAIDKVTGASSLFVGLTITCTNPAGSQVGRAEVGRNVWNSNEDFVLPALLTFKAKTTGTYTCTSSVMLCDPGNCLAPAGSGVVTVLTQKTNPKSFTYGFVSAALPPWALAYQIPKANDTLVNPNKSLTMTKTFDLASATGQIETGSVVSLTNCIVADYPPACDSASKMQVQGSAKVTVTFQVNQVPTVSGAKCAVVKAPSQTQTITWQEHHAVIDIFIPNLNVKVPVTSSCGTAVNVVTVVKVGAGNSVVVEGGSKNVWESLSYILPPPGMI